MKQLTKQQKLFVTEYIKTLNGEASAKAAGYKSKNLREIATNLLAENLIIKEIKSQLKEQISSIRVHKGYVIQKLLQIAEFSLEEEDILDKEGGLKKKKKLRDTSAGLKALESLWNVKNGRSFREESILSQEMIPPSSLFPYRRRSSTVSS